MQLARFAHQAIPAAFRVLIGWMTGPRRTMKDAGGCEEKAGDDFSWQLSFNLGTKVFIQDRYLSAVAGDCNDDE